MAPFRLLWTIPVLALASNGKSVESPYTDSERFRSGWAMLHSDTLRVNMRSLDSSSFFYYPFGEFTEMAPLRAAVTRGFPSWRFAPVKGKPDHHCAITGSDTIEFAFTDRFIIRRFEIESVKIGSNRPKLREGIRIGMGKSLFFRVFYREYPLEEIGKCRVFATCTGSCGDATTRSSEIRHFYEFTDGKLSKIEMRGKAIGALP